MFFNLFFKKTLCLNVQTNQKDININTGEVSRKNYCLFVVGVQMLNGGGGEVESNLGFKMKMGGAFA